MTLFFRQLMDVEMSEALAADNSVSAAVSKSRQFHTFWQWTVYRGTVAAQWLLFQVTLQ